ncbi:MAG: methylated-DNA--[protein]-cysteine S-methyltransferase [Bacteroidota bacterium]
MSISGLHQLSMSSPLGDVFLQATEKGVHAVFFTDENKEKLENTADPWPHLLLAKKQMEEYFEGKRKEFQLSFDLSGSAFQKKVWELLMDVPFGSQRSYLDQAKIYGDPKAIRAIAKANGENPVAIIIPCHRIVGTDGSLTGYAGGLWRKKWLLEHELKFSGKEQFSLF